MPPTLKLLREVVDCRHDGASTPINDDLGQCRLKCTEATPVQLHTRNVTTEKVHHSKCKGYTLSRGTRIVTFFGRFAEPFSAINAGICFGFAEREATVAAKTGAAGWCVAMAWAYLNSKDVGKTLEEVAPRAQ